MEGRVADDSSQEASTIVRGEGPRVLSVHVRVCMCLSVCGDCVFLFRFFRLFQSLVQPLVRRSVHIATELWSEEAEKMLHTEEQKELSLLRLQRGGGTHHHHVGSPRIYRTEQQSSLGGQRTERKRSCRGQREGRDPSMKKAVDSCSPFFSTTIYYVYHPLQT